MYCYGEGGSVLCSGSPGGRLPQTTVPLSCSPAGSVTQYNTCFSTMSEAVWTLLLAVIVLAIPPLVRPEDEVACETLPSEIHIIKGNDQFLYITTLQER